MVNVKFDKERALAVVRALKNGEPIPPPGEQWTREDALVVAGAAYLVALSHGPQHLHGVDPTTIPKEHAEAYTMTLSDDLAWAVRWCGEVTRLAMAGEYDRWFEDVHEVRVDGTKPAVHAVSGVKETLYSR